VQILGRPARPPVFFTDAYDLFVIGIVVSLLKTQWALSTNQVSWLNSATLLASAVGAIIFGRIADMLGRKSIQLLGFAMMALMFLLIGIIPGVSTTLAPFLILYGVSYFFTEFGPNMTTFIYPAELFALPETRGKSLEELEESAYPPTVLTRQATA
jgi:MFS family permease